jgi:hypothetical protein
MAKDKTLNNNLESEPPTSEQPTLEEAVEQVAEAVAGEKERGAFDQFLYHQRRAIDEASKAIDALLPEGFKSHGAEAQKEFQKGVKVLLDAAIAELERINRRAEQAAKDATGGDESRPSSTGKVKVKVQVD